MATMKMNREQYLRWMVVMSPLDEGCIEWPFYRLKGYGRVAYMGRLEYAHRAAFHVLHGRWPEVGRHSCDNPPCFNPLHVLDGSHADNQRDMAIRLRHGGMAFDAAAVDEIRRRLRAGEYVYQLVAELRLDRGTIVDAALGRRQYHAALTTSEPPLERIRRGMAPGTKRRKDGRDG